MNDITNVNMNMRKVLFSLIITLVVAVSVVGCKKPLSDEEKAKLTVEKFVEYVQNKQKIGILTIYPKCTFSDAIHLGTVTITGITPFGDDNYIVVCNNTYNDDSGELVNSVIKFNVNTQMYKEDLKCIVSSSGLIQIPSLYRFFLIKTGALHKNANDELIAYEFSAFTDFIDYYIQNTGMNIEELALQNYNGDEYKIFTTKFPEVSRVLRP